MVDYLMVSALVFLVVGLSMPTIFRLSELLRHDKPAPRISPLADFGD